MRFSRRQSVALAVAALGLGLLAVAQVQQPGVLIFNHSPSVPVGFYVRERHEPALGDFVTVRARDVAPMEAVARDYAGERDYFIKRVEAVAGQHVCSDGATLRVDGRQAASVYHVEGRSTPPGWVGCRRLDRDEVLLLGDSADSFDGRYWGPISTDLIEGVWRPL